MLDSHKKAAPDVAYVGCEFVPLNRLDGIVKAFLKDARRVFLNVDVQGYEPEVLRGASELLRHLVGMQLEASVVPLYEGQPLLQPLIDCVQEKGFDIGGFLPGLVDHSIGRLLQSDVTFFRGEKRIAGV